MGEWRELSHEVILVSEEKKEVSSSDAHLRVLKSPRFAGRVERATDRYTKLRELLTKQDPSHWKKIFRIVWDEFIDMHELFETAPEPFTYMNASTKKNLEFLRSYWNEHQDGPLVTMDAGPNIHLLYRSDQENIKQEIREACLRQK